MLEGSTKKEKGFIKNPFSFFVCYLSEAYLRLFISCWDLTRNPGFSFTILRKNSSG